jgi:hypothetical protein
MFSFLPMFSLPADVLPLPSMPPFLAMFSLPSMLSRLASLIGGQFFFYFFCVFPMEGLTFPMSISMVRTAGGRTA